MSDDDVTLFGKLKNKLIDSKQKWAADGRLLTGKAAAPSERLPPGQRRVENWPVLDLGVQPEIPLQAWRLFVDGAVETPTAWKWGAFTDLPIKQAFFVFKTKEEVEQSRAAAKRNADEAAPWPQPGTIRRSRRCGSPRDC